MKGGPDEGEHAAGEGSATAANGATLNAMRGLVAAAVAALVLALGRPAEAAGICDPQGHFCIQVDTTSARVCDVLAREGLDSDSCTPSDLELRKDLRRHDYQPLRALVLRFDDWKVFVAVLRHDAEPELAESEVGAHAASVRGSLERVRHFDAFPPPTLARVHDVQTVRLDGQWTEGDDKLEEIDVEVRGRHALYVVTFLGDASPRLSAFADATIGTLDTVPMRSPQSAGDGLTWLLRGGILAAAVAALALWLGRRKGRGPGIDSRDLWPR
jgi:hypothetical protein